MPFDRRTFLHRAAMLGLLGPLAAAACGGPDQDSDHGGPQTGTPGGRRITRPRLVPGAAGTVHILTPIAEPPAAYLSRSDMRVYLDPAYRDWAEHRLAAYVSVTTGLWRIPRPEDDPRVPIIPGDELREFEVVHMGSWNPDMTPVEGDARLRLRAPVPVRMDLSCALLVTGDAWISAESLVLQRRDGPAGVGGREDFVAVGTGTRHRDDECTAVGDSVRLLSWVCPTGEGGSGEPS